MSEVNKVSEVNKQGGTRQSLIDLVSVRELEVGDVNFILDSSIQCLRRYTESVSMGMGLVESVQYLETTILYALQRMGYSIFIACEAEESNNIVGYIVADTTKNHIYLQYTKYAFRGMGIQKDILLPLVVDPTKPLTYNWPTKAVLKLVKQQKAKVAKVTELDMIARLEGVPS